jgi:hypothetical protein
MKNRALESGSKSGNRLLRGEKEINISLKEFYKKNIGKVFDEAQLNDNKSDFSASFYGPVYSDKGEEIINDDRGVSCTRFHKKKY